MKQALVAALLAALLSSVLTLSVDRALRGRTTTEAPVSPGSELAGPLSDLERTLDRFRRDLSELRAGQLPLPGPSGGTAGPVGAEASAAPQSSRGTGPGKETDRAEGPLPAQLSLSRFSELLRPADAADGSGIGDAGKAKWILRGEDAVLAWFGKPTRIEVKNSGEEIWFYWLPTGETHREGELISEQFSIRMNRGRLVGISSE